MSQTVTLPDEIFENLDRSAKCRGLTLVSFLGVLGRAFGDSVPGTADDEQRAACIDRLFAKCREGAITPAEQAELTRLVNEDYGVALERADRRIAEKLSRKSQPRHEKRSATRRRS